MTFEAPKPETGHEHWDEFPHREFVDAFQDTVARKPMGAKQIPAAEELMQGTFLPLLEMSPPPANFDAFNNKLCSLETRFGHAAYEAIGPQDDSFVRLLMDGIEDYVLETQIFPQAFPDRTYEPLGEVKFRGIWKLPNYIQARLVPSLFPNDNKSIKELREIDEQREDKLDRKVDNLSQCYAEQMSRKVAYGDQYRQYLEALEYEALEEASKNKSRYRVRDHTPTSSRGTRGSTTANVVAKTREYYLREVFASIEQ